MSVTGAVEVIRDLEYASAEDRSLRLDLYRPQDRPEPCPVVLYLHGGAFMVGAKDDFAQERLVPLVRAGVAVASAEYRFSDIATYPAQLHDVKAAVRWLRAHASRYGLRSERVGAWGASAGAYLALMLGLTAGSTEHEGTLGEHLQQPSSVEAVTSWFAPVDLRAVASAPPPDRDLPPFITGPWPPPGPSIMARLLGVQDVGDEPKLAAASPLSYASEARGAYLLMHGDRDGMISEQQSRQMHDALTAAGAESTLLLLAGANHEDPAFQQPAPLGAVAAFFQACL